MSSSSLFHVLPAQAASAFVPFIGTNTFIPIRKYAAWWTLTQDERRAIFEDESTHIQTGLKYLPAIARRLHHCRVLGPEEPSDFLTWFELAPADSAAFNELLGELRASREWRYVEREIDIRLMRDAVPVPL